MISRVAEFIFFGVAPLLIGLAAIPANLSAAERTIAGEVLYRERIALPPDAAVLVQLLDVSLADAASRILSEQTIKPAGQVPIPFKLSFDADRIKPGRTYALQARITVGSTIWFITDMRNTVDPGAASSPQSLLLKMVHQSETLQTRPEDMIFDRTWLAEDIEQRGVIDTAQSTLRIGSDGKISGIGACNNYFSTASVKGTKLQIGEIGSTRKLCPPAIMDQERKFFEALSKAAGFHFDGTGKLHLVDAAGRALLRFAQAG
ncbi:putative lipoprotein [Mesorhizobium albiziae]|uniref:Putative lipoprotein n=1 Tax=Neomesorhizobium albiziae TaxID=335020 RepID=A0A1I4DEV3_9HYPH|nr:YbaY family lipoprotein [Mesorhizobium albiziae]GLS32369.1 hypothetical protein GCM10007937_40790 [Mesorhizobium albiziae]SFK91685.1 putative lipoprotein [Mesorhizobium albiziae]